MAVSSLPPVLAAEAADLKLRAQLIWGTDGAKPADAQIKELDAETQDKLKGVFKWKNYFEVTARNFEVPARTRKAVRLSPKCEIEVEHLGDALVEVKLFGEGRMVVKRKQTLKAGELLVLAGDDKNNTAWFVILKAVDR